MHSKLGYIIINFLKKPRVQNYLMYLFFILSSVSCFVTYLLFFDVRGHSYNSTIVISILYFDAICILFLLLLSSNKIIELWARRHKKGFRLTLRLISTFSLLSIVPSVLMSVFSAIFFHNGIESWFNEHNQVVLQESLNVANSYLNEHKKRTLGDCISISRTLEYHLEMASENFDEDHKKFYRNIGFLLDDLCGVKGVDAAVLLDSHLNIIAHSKYSVSLHFLNINSKEVEKLAHSHKKNIILDIDDTGIPKSIVAVSCFGNLNKLMYLIIENSIDSNVLLQANNTKIAYDEYNRLSKSRYSLEVIFIFIFFIVGALLLIASIFVAISYSWRIVNPVSNLIDASGDIIKGNMKARVSEESTYEEIKLLCKTFNQMVEQIENQREDLISINKKLNERIKFINSVLSGVSSGVIGINNDYAYIWNNAAEELLGRKLTANENINDIFPEIKELLKSIKREGKPLEKEIQFIKNNSSLLFSVKIENLSSKGSKFVLTFDNLTGMVEAQRKAAWIEIARRVAHEIKNPLTPIQLSAERIKRKYISQITENTEIFLELINVIVQQVGDIKRLIDEFNFFARMPEPKIKECNLCKLCEQAVFLMQNASSDVDISFNSSINVLKIEADDRLLHQVIVNLIQNSINALSTIEKDDKRVIVSVGVQNGKTMISVEDSGPGLPEEKIKSLATPYFTLMPKGTGLGLAIVKKITQDHGGKLSFGNSFYGGAKIIISFPGLECIKNEK